MSKATSIPESSTGALAIEILQVNSNKITDVLSSSPATTLESTQHVRVTSTPSDDLVEEDFADRVRSLIQKLTRLVSLTVCIPSMARLHPSNSLPKVLNVLHDVSVLCPHCHLGLAVYEAEQAWSALPLLKHIAELRLGLRTIEFTRAFFPVEELIQIAPVCGLTSLTLDATQVFSSSSSPNTAPAATNGRPGQTSSALALQSLAIRAQSEASPGLDFLLRSSAGSIVNLDIGSSSGVGLQDLVFPDLARLTLHEALLPEAKSTQMPMLEVLVFPTLTKVELCDLVQETLKWSWSHVKELTVSRVVAGDVSDALMRLAEKHPSVRVTIGELAVGNPLRLTPGALAMSEHLVSLGPPISGDWPRGFGGQRYARLKSIVLKVHDGHNHEEFIASIDAPHMEKPPSISLIQQKKGKPGRK